MKSTSSPSPSLTPAVSSLKVYLNGALEMSITGVFKDGRVAHYEFSQEGVSFTPVG